MLGRLSEILADLPLFLFFKPVFAHELGILLVVFCVNDLRVFWRKDFIEFLFVESTRFAIYSDKECFVAKRFYVLAIMISYVTCNFRDTLFAFEKIFEIYGSVEDFV